MVLLALLVYEVFYWWRTSRRYRERLESEHDQSDETGEGVTGRRIFADCWKDGYDYITTLSNHDT